MAGRPPRSATNHTGGGTGEEQPHRPPARDRGAAEPAARLHDLQRRIDLAWRGLLEPRQVGPTRGFMYASNAVTTVRSYSRKVGSTSQDSDIACLDGRPRSARAYVHAPDAEREQEGDRNRLMPSVTSWAAA